jgi:hypothetical protein
MRAHLLAAGLLLWAGAASAAAPGADPDWPCQQVLVPVLSAGMLWTGPSVDQAGNWHTDADVAALVQRVSPSDVPVDQGEAAIADFARALGGDRARRLTLVFAGLLDETNRQRSDMIEGIKDLGERQRNLARLIDRLTAELDAAPNDAQADTAARAELQQRWTFTSRTYAEVQRTMQYACDAPRTLDARLGAYARALEKALPKS